MVQASAFSSEASASPGGFFLRMSANLAPLIGAGAAGYLFRSGVLAAETVIPIRGKGGSDVPPAASAPGVSEHRHR